jgi:serine/threonine protein kinase
VADFKPPVYYDTKDIILKVGVPVAAATLLLFIIVGVFWKKRRDKNDIDKELRGLDLQTGTFTLRQIKAATDNFDVTRKIGEGGFGSVYKGELSEGKLIAVKQLSAKSRQGNREFVNEIGMISALQHPNLVKLYGCCVEGNQLILVYEYLENNCLSRALFGMLFLSNLHLRNYPVELLLRIFVWVIFFCRKG